MRKALVYTLSSLIALSVFVTQASVNAATKSTHKTPTTQTKTMKKQGTKTGGAAATTRHCYKTRTKTGGVAVVCKRYTKKSNVKTGAAASPKKSTKKSY